MTKKYLVITHDLWEVRQTEDITIPIELLQRTVGDPENSDPENVLIEGYWNQFADETIVIWTDERYLTKGKKKEWRLTCITPQRLKLYGCIVITGKQNKRNQTIHGLTKKQIELVKSGLGLE